MQLSGFLLAALSIFASHTLALPSPQNEDCTPPQPDAIPCPPGFVSVFVQNLL